MRAASDFTSARRNLFAALVDVDEEESDRCEGIEMAEKARRRAAKAVEQVCYCAYGNFASFFSWRCCEVFIFTGT